MEAILYYWPDFTLYAAEVNLFVNFITAIICWPAMIILGEPLCKFRQYNEVISVRGHLKPEPETLVTKNKNETDLVLVYRRLPPKLQAKMTEFGNAVVPELCSDPTESVIITTPGTNQ